jgi:hypothetical protein
MDMTLLKKTMQKQFEMTYVAVLDNLLSNVNSDETLTDETKKLFEDKVTNFKVELKEALKNDSKKKKREKGTRQPTRYNRYMKIKMAELKTSEPDLSNNDKFAKIASLWKQEKDTWVDPEAST